MTTTSGTFRAGAVALFLALFMNPGGLPAQCPAMARGALPIKYPGKPTSAPIQACDLMTRLYQFADDSMAGRRAGSPEHLRATGYILAEVKRLGLRPAGESGGYFQNLPLMTRALDTNSTIVVADMTLRTGTDFLVSTTAMHLSDFAAIKLAYGGTLLDTTVTLSTGLTDGTIVIFRPVPAGTDQAAIQRTVKGKAWVAWYNSIRNRATANAAQIPAATVRTATNPTAAVTLVEQGATISLTLTISAAEKLFGGPLESIVPGSFSKPFSLNLKFIDTQRINRNLIAVLPGSDSKLRGEYVALGAHSDHLGTLRAGLDHDSVRAFHLSSRAGTEGAASRKQTTEDDEYDRIHALTDSLHKARGVRQDSIYNGADDGGSGTVALLEIAEQFARAPVKPKRSILFVWHTGTESAPALTGSTWFTDHPTVPRDSIVAQLTVDLIGRGEVADETGVNPDESARHGNPDYLEILASRRQSTEFGALIEQSNIEAKTGLHLDYAADNTGDPDGLYCRNDQSSYARYGIPVAFFTTGYHADFREITDEPQYIQYQHMARIVQLVAYSTLKIANLDHRPVVDKPKPDPKGRCVP